MPHDPAYGSIVHWRRSWWNGARCEPILLTLHEGRLRATDRAGHELFAVPPGQVAGRLSRFGTLLLDVGGQTFHLVGRGGAQAPSPTAEQQRAYADFRARHPEPAPTDRPGLVDQLVNGAAAWRMRRWRDALRAAGAGVAR
ncbi:hypothetical protein MRQ36_32385 [Micromonospora sp. R77]|uniref:hypothetical protein n=1 Tax=Micromonospora sp. R77 TaxID=2925836 RepID=UPI001F622063|nr:hypothetical protein [Micromonospora sp. R77]MCI4067013.1 hypothetical protein [Micromonospora sp. R77]